MFNITKLFIIPYIFIFFMYFYTQIGPFMFPYSFVTRMVFFILIPVLKLKEFIKYLVFIFKKTSFKYFVYFYLWIIISGIICMFTVHYSASRFLYYVLFQFVFGCISIFLMTGFIFPKYISLKFLIKFLVCAYFFLFFFGFIEHIGHVFNITFIQSINDFFVNQRFSEDNYTPELNRVKSLFGEPSWYATFICFNFPIMYQLTKTKFRIFKYKDLNTFVKIMLIPFAIISVILTKSPIWTLLFLLEVVICYQKKILKYLKQVLGIIAITLMLLFFVHALINFEINESHYLYRIVLFFQSFYDLDKFVVMEASLANRVISYYFTLLIFLKHPIIGVGFWNVPTQLSNVITNSGIPLTSELHMSYLRYIVGINSIIKINSAIFYNVLAETGIVGFILLYTFFIKTFIQTKKIALYLFGIERAFTTGVAYSVLVIILTSVYDTFLTTIYIWLILGIALACYRCAMRK